MSWAPIHARKTFIILAPGLRPCYDLPATEKWANRRKNVRLVAEVVRLVSQRSWVIARGKSVATRSMVMFKTGRANLRPVAPPIDCSRRIPWLIVRSIFGAHDYVQDNRKAPHERIESCSGTFKQTIQLWRSLLIGRGGVVASTPA